MPLDPGRPSSSGRHANLGSPHSGEDYQQQLGLENAPNSSLDAAGLQTARRAAIRTTL